MYGTESSFEVLLLLLLLLFGLRLSERSLTLHVSQSALDLAHGKLQQEQFASGWVVEL